MKKTVGIVLLVGVALVAVAADLMSGWSRQSNGLKMQVTSPEAFARMATGVVQLEVACTVMNVGNTSTSVSQLARICLIDSTGVTNECYRAEDVEDTSLARSHVAPGQTTSWKQDGRLKTAAGMYRLFVVLDDDKALRSPPIDINMK